METKKCYSTTEHGVSTLGGRYSTTEQRRPTLGGRYSTIEHGVSTLGTRYSTIEQPIFRQKAHYSTTEHRIHRCDFKHEFLRSVGAQALRGVPRINHEGRRARERQRERSGNLSFARPLVAWLVQE